MSSSSELEILIRKLNKKNEKLEKENKKLKEEIKQREQANNDYINDLNDLYEEAQSEYNNQLEVNQDLENLHDKQEDKQKQEIDKLKKRK